MSTVFWILEILGISTNIFALVLLSRGDGSRDQKLMQLFLVGALIQNVGYLLELTAPTVEAAIVSVKVQYLGSLVIPISYCHFAFNYCHEKAPEIILRLVRAVDLFILCAVLTCDRHRFYYRDIAWATTAGGHGYLDLSYGPGYWIFMVCCTAVPFFLSLYALMRVCVRNPEYAADRRCKLILTLSVLPVLALCSYAMKLTHVYDLTPLVLGAVLSAVVILVWSRKVYDFNSLASSILLDSMSDGVIALDDRRRIASYNPAAAKIFKGLGPRAIGRRVDVLDGFPHDVPGGIKGDFSLDGRFYQGHVESIVNRYGKNIGYVVLILDVTETKNYIEEIVRIREQAEQANIAKSAFLANMSHEIRTPMNAIVGLSDIMMEESRGRKVYEYACDIKSASGNLLTLINDILDLSKVEAGKMELVMTKYHLKTLVNEVLGMMDIVASKRGLMVKSEFDMSIPCMYRGDEGRIKQILINILNNAVKFTKEGSVAISVGGVPGGAENTEEVYFCIKDTGCGIKAADMAGIFDNFKQVDSKRNRSVEGTGLGLSITKHLVELMGGTIEVDSVYGEGTTFTVRIPQKIVDKRPLSEVPESSSRKDEKLEPFLAKDYTVLVVDDNAVNRKIARIMLQSYGMSVEEADSGRAAIELVRGKCYDIIFMDHMMPEMDGIEAVHIIREDCGENGKLPVVIALTANAMEGVKGIFLANGFQDFVTKPLDRRVLHEALLRWIPQERRKMDVEWADLRKGDDGRGMKFRSISIEGIDTDEVIRRYSGSIEDYREILHLYCLDGRRKLDLLRELWERGDYKDYGIEVHGLKSASANIGAMKISNSAREQERAVDRGDHTFVDSHAAELLDDYGRQIEYIAEYLTGKRAQDKADEAGIEIANVDLARILMEALECLEDFRSKECAQKLEGLAGYRLASDIANRVREVQGQLKLYEDEAAEQMLRELIRTIDEYGERGLMQNDREKKNTGS